MLTMVHICDVIVSLKGIDLLDRDTGKEPVLETKSNVMHVSYTNGTSGFKETTFTDWMCPVCGWFVGELYSGFGRWHIQRETSYCARCGQKIDWTKPSDEEKRRYERIKAAKRKEFEQKNGHKLDNMYEGLRRKYGELNNDGNESS